MKTLAVVVICLIASVLYTARGLFRALDTSNYYPPTVHADSQYRSISIAVEIDKKGGKSSFVDLFRAYGFSGNGPAIEQVVKINIETKNLRYDSEGDAFVVVAADQESYLQAVREISEILKIETLNNWLRKSAWIPIKE